MLTLTTLKAQLLMWFKLMAANDMYIDISYKGDVYRLHIENLHQRVQRKRRPRSYKQMILTSKCPDCSGLLVNGVCTNQACSIKRLAPAPRSSKRSRPRVAQGR